MQIERTFRIARSRDEVVDVLCDDATLLELLPGETELVESRGDLRTTRTRYDLLGREGFVTFHFTYLLDGNVRFEKECDGRVWRKLTGEVIVDEDGEDRAVVRIEMRGSTKTLVPELAIKGPLEEQIEAMTRALRERLR